MKKVLILLLLLGEVFANLAIRSTGFALDTGPMYRQDRLVWQAYTSPQKTQEIYPALRMFDWMARFDLSLVGIHLFGEGDMGWFSSQSMRKAVLVDGTATNFSYNASGRLATGDLRLGYQIDLVRTNYTSGYSLVPTLGWFYNGAKVRRTHPIPPISDEISITYLSNLHQKWDGPTAGAQMFCRLNRGTALNMGYAFGWLELSQRYAESVGSLSTTQAMISGARALGQIVNLELAFDLSSGVFFSLLFRYFYLHTDTCHVDAEQNGVSEILKAQALDRSYTGGASLGWAF